MSDNVPKYDYYYVYYQPSALTYRVFNSKTKKIKTVSSLPPDVSKFGMLRYKDLGENDDDLITYAELFEEWCEQLREDRYIKFDYSDCYCDYTAVTRMFNRKAGVHYQNSHEPICTTEWRWFERCYNSGLQYLRENDIVVKCYSNDFKNQYPRCMNSNAMIPTKPGKEKTLDELPPMNELKAGFYHVKVLCDNDDFRKIFSFCKHNVYVKESLAHAMKYAKQFGVKFKLVKDGKPNAYLYKDKDLVTLRSVCGVWYSYLKMQRDKPHLKDNPLLKHMFKSAWSSINADNAHWYTEEQMEEKGLDFGYGSGYDYEIIDEVYDSKKNKQKFKLLNTAKPYKHNLRLKPWVTALSRNLTAEMALKDIDNVVRIQTDSVSYTVKQEFDDKLFVTEDKTTGKIHFITVNAYENLTTGYKSGAFDRSNRKLQQEDED
jgi:hypothetical protein